ncbi:MAG: 3-isopropylmalate dehydratase large subunit [Aestuariivita sp.]|nr:3-isopropylmalate dehydratase large subunit [Aestuariivita sp.]MCY4201741.1 3-isopropylmalate dehydratase large subunit [Aestuariivita sp.]
MTTLLDKLWDSHEIYCGRDGRSLLWVDRHLVHEGSHHAFSKLAERNSMVIEPNLTFGVADHYVPTRGTAASPAIIRMIETLERNAEKHGITYFGQLDSRQGIVHVIGPEQGLTLPGLLITCGDSHTSTHGAFGALAFGIGATEVSHVLATQTIWQSRPKSMRIAISGNLLPGVGSKDLALAWIAKLGADGAREHAVEYTGSAVRRLSMDGRMTLCNMSIEGGARFGMIAPDETTFAYIKDRPFAPSDALFERAQMYWETLTSDENAEFDREVCIDASEIAPIVTWGTSPEDALPVTATVPNPTALAGTDSERVASAIDYMGLVPGRALTEVQIDQVFIGSCTNARIEDLRAAAAVLAGRRAKVPGLVSPGSQQIKAQAEAEGLDHIFIDAGLEWGNAGCSMCVAMNGDRVQSGKRCASTTNRNFRGRQGRDARTHLMSPAMVAAAAITGHLTDVRPFLKERLTE